MKITLESLRLAFPGCRVESHLGIVTVRTPEGTLRIQGTEGTKLEFVAPYDVAEVETHFAERQWRTRVIA